MGLIYTTLHTTLLHSTPSDFEGKRTEWNTMPPKRKSNPCAVCNKAIVDGKEEALF